jgi:hypothetical protein
MYRALLVHAAPQARVLGQGEVVCRAADLSISALFAKSPCLSSRAIHKRQSGMAENKVV